MEMLRPLSSTFPSTDAQQLNSEAGQDEFED
jgi:hypothetical protein